DLFEALAAGSGPVAEARARAAGCDLSRPHVVVHVEPVAGDAEGPLAAERIESRLRRLAGAAVCDIGRQSVRAVLTLNGSQDTLPAVLGELSEVGTAEGVHIGMSDSRRGAQDGARGLREAADASHVAKALAPAGGAFAYSDLG